MDSHLYMSEIRSRILPYCLNVTMVIYISIFILHWLYSQIGLQLFKYWPGLLGVGWIWIFAVARKMIIKLIQNIMQNDRRKEEIIHCINSVLLNWFAFHYLLFSAVLLFIGSNRVSAITLIGDEKNEYNLSLQEERGDSFSVLLDKENNLKFHWISTSSFGRSFSIGLKGYHDKIDVIYPGSGKKVKLPQDLEVSPSIAVTVPFGHAMRLRSIGRIEISLNSSTIAVKSTDGRFGTIVFGDKFQAINNKITEEWERYLDEAKEESSRMHKEKVFPRNKILNIWEQPPIFGKTKVKLRKGDEINIKFFIKGENEPKLKAVHLLTDSLIQNVRWPLKQLRKWGEQFH